MDDFISLTEIGRIYGVSSHKVGKWLKSLGLRTNSGDPSPTAFADKMVKKYPSRQPGTYFYLWGRSKTTEILDGMQYPRAVLNPDEQQHRSDHCGFGWDGNCLDDRSGDCPNDLQNVE